MYQTHRGPRYRQRSTVTVSVEYEILQRVKDLAAERRYTLSEIVNSSFLDFIQRHNDKK